MYIGRPSRISLLESHVELFMYKQYPSFGNNHKNKTRNMLRANFDTVTYPDTEKLLLVYTDELKNAWDITGEFVPRAYSAPFC